MIRAGPIPPEQKGPPMSLLYAATVKTKKGTARLDRGGRVRRGRVSPRGGT